HGRRGHAQGGRRHGAPPRHDGAGPREAGRSRRLDRRRGAVMEAPHARKRVDSIGGSAWSGVPGRLAWLLVAGAVFLVLGRACGCPRVRWHDPTTVTERPPLPPPSPSNLVAIWSAPWAGLYIPASYTFWWIEMHVSRLFAVEGAPDPRVFHAGLLLLHAS